MFAETEEFDVPQYDHLIVLLVKHGLPDDLPHEYVLEIAKPYLGEFWSGPSDWTPMKNRVVFFKENPENQFDHEDIWQFKNFIFVQ